MNFIDPAEPWIVPQWDAPANVRALITTRAGGVSTGPWSDGSGGGGMNLGYGTGDDRQAVKANRAQLSARLPQAPRWLAQVHGSAVVEAETVELEFGHAHLEAEKEAEKPRAGRTAERSVTRADASTSVTPGVVCAVQIADCMPVLLADLKGTVVGAVHAGWRGLAAGVIQKTVRAMRGRSGRSDARIVAFLGPAIGPTQFEVGADVFDAIQASLPGATQAFKHIGPGKYHADLFALGKQALAQAGVDCVAGGTDCTYSDSLRFFSFRRDRITGRHAALVWLVTRG